MKTAILSLTLAAAALFMPISQIAAATVGASGSVSVEWNVDGATDLNGENVDWSDADYSITGANSLSTSSGVSGPPGVSSSSNSVFYLITNISVDKILSWSAYFNAFASAGASGANNVLGESYYDGNSFVTVGSISSFAAVTGSPQCTVLNPNSPNFDCFDFSEGNSNGESGFDFGSLAPGETRSFELSVQSFAAQRFTPSAPVPLPASGLALALALCLLGLGLARNQRIAAKTRRDLAA